MKAPRFLPKPSPEIWQFINIRETSGDRRFAEDFASGFGLSKVLNFAVSLKSDGRKGMFPTEWDFELACLRMYEWLSGNR